MNSKISKILVSGIAFIVAAAIGYFSVSYFFTDKKDTLEMLKEEAKRINNKTPVQIDEETRLDSVVATSESSFDYFYTLIYKSDSVNKDTIAKYVKPTIVAKLKTNPEMDYFREHKITLNYHYYGYDGLPAVTINITPELYKK